MPDFETRLKDVSRAAWLIWTANGLRLDDFELEQTSKSATDTANNAYVEGVSNKDWVDDTLMRLRSEELTKTIMVPGNPPAHQTLNSPINGGEPSITISVSSATPTSATKRHALRRTAWCCIRRATTTRSNFTTCTGFIRTISKGSNNYLCEITTCSIDGGKG
jgi:hypothetical protein